LYKSHAQVAKGSKDLKSGHQRQLTETKDQLAFTCKTLDASQQLSNQVEESRSAMPI
jgi:hypothetical protein